MHPNPAFRGRPDAVNIAFARSVGFGTLTVNGDRFPLLSHIPFLLSESGEEIEFHLVRSNPIARLLGAFEARLSVIGPHSYISPDWYEADDQVPTWNYVAVHLMGEACAQPAEQLVDLLSRQSAFYEERLLPKPMWTLDKMSDDALDRMLRQIVPFRMSVTAVDGTWKLGQNKPKDARLKAAKKVGSDGIRDGLEALAGLMKSPPAP